MSRYLCDPTFSRFDTIPECDRQTHRHMTTAYTALSIASHGKNINFENVKCDIYLQPFDRLMKFGMTMHNSPPNLMGNQKFKI